MSEWIWTKIGFGLVAFVAAIIWGLMFYPFVSLFNTGLPLASLLIGFVVVFVFLGLVNEKILGNAGLGAIAIVVGAISVLFVAGGVAPVESNRYKLGRDFAVCFLAGLVSVLVAIYLY